MKKILCLVMTLMLLVLCPAMAETVVEKQTLTSPDGSYSIEVPADYMSLNAELVANLFATEEMQQLLAQALGLPDASQLGLYLSMIEANNMMLVFTENMIGNLNIQAVPASLTMEQMVMLKDALDASIIQQYASLGVAEEDVELMEIQEIGGRQWYSVKLVMAGMPIQTLMTEVGGIQYALTFTYMDEAAMLSILESFTVATPAE